MKSLTVESPVVEPGADIPRRYTCDGEDRSLPLRWGAPPPGTQAFAVIVDDPDAPAKVWVHFVAWNLLADARSLAEGLTADARGLVQGKNDFGRIGWGGPCPPPPHDAHRYFVRLYALDATLDLSVGATRQQLDQAMSGHVLAEGEWMGKYKRERK